MQSLKLLYLIVTIIVTTVAGAITAFRMRRRIRRALGREVTDTELTSISTWMKVEEAEQNPDSSRFNNPS